MMKSHDCDIMGQPMTQKPTIILGIDPGYDRVGWAVISRTAAKSSYLASGLIQTQASDEIFIRYHQIWQQLTQIISLYLPTTCHLESLFFARNQKTALRVSEARGLIIANLITHQVKVKEFTPLQAKLAVTGYGQADKTAMAKMVHLQLKLPHLVMKDDELDALALCLC